MNYQYQECPFYNSNIIDSTSSDYYDVDEDPKPINNFESARVEEGWNCYTDAGVMHMQQQMLLHAQLASCCCCGDEHLIK